MPIRINPNSPTMAKTHCFFHKLLFGPGLGGSVSEWLSKGFPEAYIVIIPIRTSNIIAISIVNRKKMSRPENIFKIPIKFILAFFSKKYKYPIKILI